jgi:hypothetical protein
VLVAAVVAIAIAIAIAVAVAVATNGMIENLLYVIAGFAVTYLSLEVAWHFTACKIKERDSISDCHLILTKQI